ncbi:uncharacterized protein [Choristoneura fumiferana]|uniref:uncharacterized protein n=1 Tax=Choristoneura fumiferana TaxID=7141 RepID=UPI003D159AA4
MAFETYVVVSILLPVFFSPTCDAIKCFDCNSANNSACMDLNLSRMRGIVPLVDCSTALPNSISKQFFCRKITQTILRPNQTPEVRITRGCGWVKSKKECYSADNKDRLETVCQCFGDMCNAASALRDVKLTVLAALAAIFVSFRSWRGKV